MVAGLAVVAALALSPPGGAEETPTPGGAEETPSGRAEGSSTSDGAPNILDAPPEAGDPSVRAAGAALWDPADERLLFGQEADRPRPMASLTKMLTAVLLVNNADVDDVVTASATAAGVGGATVGLQAGQEVPMESLVAGLIVESGNDAAVAAAEHVAGSEDAFVELMSERARELGADSAAFVNASGLTNDPAHHATPTGLAKLGAAAMEEPLIAQFADDEAVVVEGLPPLVNRNELLGSYPGADGIKTGHTAAAGFSLAGSATRDGWRLIAVVLDSPDRGADAARLLDWGFATFDRAEVAEAGSVLAAWRGESGGGALAVDSRLGATVPSGAAARMALRLAPHIDEPVPAGAAVGRAELVVEGETVGAAPLTAVDGFAAAQANEPGGAARLGRGLATALRGLARAGAADAAAPRQDGSVEPGSN